MSRPSRNGKEFPSDAKLYTLSNGEYKMIQSPQRAVVLLKGAGKGDAVSRWVLLAEMLFGKGVKSFYVLDISALLKDVPKEMATTGMGPVLKPISRVIQKLNAKEVTLVGLASTCGLMAKLLRQEIISMYITKGVAIQPENSLQPIRDPLPPTPVPFHLMHIGSANEAEIEQWKTMNAGAVTASLIRPKADLKEAIASAVVGLLQEDGVFDTLSPVAEIDIKGYEIVFTLSPYTKMTEQTYKEVVVQPFEAPRTANKSAPPMSTSIKPPAARTVSAIPSTAPATTAPVQTQVTITEKKPTEAEPKPAVLEWWKETRDDFFAAESHIWSLRPGAAIERMPVRVLASELPKSRNDFGWAKVADSNGSVRVAYHGSCAAHVKAFKSGNAVALTGKVMSDEKGKCFISIPADEPRAAEILNDDEISMLVGDHSEMSAAELVKTGTGISEVQHKIGCVLVRGSKIVLARVKKDNGRRELVIPTGRPVNEETPEATAMRVLAEHLDVDPDEFALTPQLGTLTRFPEQGTVETLFFATAIRAPPGGASKDAAEWPVDTASPYDWFTLKHALRVSYNEWHSTLWAVAQRLHDAVHAGIVAPKWKCSVFGLKQIQARDAGEEVATSSQPSLLDVSVPNGLETIVSALQEYTQRAQNMEEELMQLKKAATNAPIVAPEEAKPVQTKPKVESVEVTPVVEAVKEKEDVHNNKLPDSIAQLPTTVISGWLGAGKTTLLKKILGTDLGLRVAVLVNDMADINIDAALVRSDVSITRAEENLVELSSGCICCTLRQDLLEEVAKLANEGRFDYLVIESSGISEPLHVAETFSFEVNGAKLDQIARIDTMVTVLDGPVFLKDVRADSSETLHSTGMVSDDGRSVVTLLIEQVEFADIILLNKNDLLTDDERQRLHSLIREFNNYAKIIDTVGCNVDINEVINTHSYSENRSKEHPEWLEADHVHPEMGISSFVYRKRKPFHPARLHKTLSEGGLPNVIRSKGYIWLATRNSLVGVWSQAAKQMTLDGGQHWWSSMPKEEWPAGVEEELIKGNLWQEPYGDKQQELVIIGYLLEQEAVEKVLDTCLLTDEELKGTIEEWEKLDDPFPSWVEGAHTHDGHDHSHAHSHSNSLAKAPVKATGAGWELTSAQQHNEAAQVF
eukprot:TRINITY_DN7531_c0_g2_i1.p1 TRINITY_DN7531_c0_g2~~TRINITY_DN7531_c0_g2_i1.p1  ORF type:complete len:1142 (+),score=314.94 TRINITY_DN7531_c0_g2_i1:33-3458(+)